MRNRKRLLLSLSLCLCFSLALAADGKPQVRSELTAAQIVERNIAARGGLQAWRSVQTMSWAGKMDAGGGSRARSQRMSERRKRTAAVQVMSGKDVSASKEVQPMQLPFVLEMKRPTKSRVEVQFAGKTAVQVYDGNNGWKVRPFLNRNEVEPFTPEEAKAEAGRVGLDGPLVDYTAKGTKVELEAVEPVEGHDAYKLKLTTKTGDVQHIWIDKQSFLDVKVEGAPRRMDGRLRTVWIYQREFKSVEGLLVPFVLETAVDGYRETHKMVIERVEVNPNLNDALFTKPSV